MEINNAPCADWIVENKLKKQDEDENPNDLYDNGVKDDKKTGDDDAEIEDIHRSTYDENLGDWIVEYGQRNQPKRKEFNVWPVLRKIGEHYTDNPKNKSKSKSRKNDTNYV